MLSQEYSKPKILFVDDIWDVLRFFGEVAREHNIHFSYATTLDDAERLIKNDGYTLLVLDKGVKFHTKLDIGPFRHGGLNFARQVKDDYPNTEVVIFSAEGYTTEIERCGADGFINKGRVRWNPLAEHIMVKLENNQLVTGGDSEEHGIIRIEQQSGRRKEL